MSHEPHVLLLNATCLDVVNAHEEWLSSLPINLAWSEYYRSISPDELHELVCGSDAVIGQAVHEIRSETMQEAKRLKIISLASSGYDSIDVVSATSSGILVTNAPVEAGVEVVADMAIGLMLAVGRQICLHNQLIRSGNYVRGMGTTIWQKKLGIIGLGNIGRAVARRAKVFDMQVLASDPYADPEYALREGIELVGLEQLLAQSDFVSLHVRANESTRGMIGYDQLRRMKPSGFLINTARRDLVVEADLNRALEENCLAGAGLDDPPKQPTSPLLERDNVVFTTHLGNRARIGVDAVFRCAVENVVNLLEGRDCPSIVNPEVLSHSRLARKVEKLNS